MSGILSGAKCALVLGLGMASVQGGAANAGTSLPKFVVGKPPFEERLTPKVEMAGGALIGAMAGDLRQKIPARAVILDGISPQDALLCVSIRSVTGAYWARFVVANPRLGPSVRFVLPPGKFPGVGARAGEMAVLARAGVAGVLDCRNDDPMLRARWSDDPPGDGVALLVNDHQAELTQVVKPDPVMPCQALVTVLGGPVAMITYNQVCPVTMPPACGAPQAVTVELDDANRSDYLRSKIRRLCP